MIKKRCKGCGKEYFIYPHQKDLSKYCSNKCKNKELSIMYKKRGIKPPSRRGKHWIPSEETKRKMSIYAKSIKRKPPSRKGSHHTEMTKKKLREYRLNQILPSKDTKIEKMLQRELDKKNIKYKKHIPVCNICKPDIVFPERKVAIFADGDYFHSPNFKNGLVWDRDRKQDKILIDNGWAVLRFWEHEIKNNITNCINEVMKIWDDRIGVDSL